MFFYLKGKNAITSAYAPQAAEERMLGDDSTLLVIDKNGEFLPGEGFDENYLTPNAPVKIFLNIGDSYNFV